MAGPSVLLPSWILIFCRQISAHAQQLPHLQGGSKTMTALLLRGGRQQETVFVSLSTRTQQKQPQNDSFASSDWLCGGGYITLKNRTRHTTFYWMMPATQNKEIPGMLPRQFWLSSFISSRSRRFRCVVAWSGSYYYPCQQPCWKKFGTQIPSYPRTQLTQGNILQRSLRRVLPENVDEIYYWR